MEEKPIVKSKISNVIFVLLLVAVAVSISFLTLRTFVFDRYQVNGISMMPTISDGDWVWANKHKNAERYDVVSISAGKYIEKANLQIKEIGGTPIDSSPSILLKRVIGVEGDVLSARDGKWVQIERADGTIIILDNEDYGKGPLAPLSYWLYGGSNFSRKTESVPAGFVFVLGDMRGKDGVGSVSVDSRMFGFVAVEDIIAVVYGYRPVN